jgi:hypothetical protein
VVLPVQHKSIAREGLRVSYPEKWNITISESDTGVIRDAVGIKSLSIANPQMDKLPFERLQIILPAVQLSS